MKHSVNSMDVFGFVKPVVDVHTMGIYTIANLLRDCGYKVHLAKDDVNAALENIQKVNNYSLVKRWILDKGITRIGFSYRLDPREGCDYFMALYTHLKDDKMFVSEGGPLAEISFAGLPDTCDLVKAKTDGKILVFPGNETPIQSLRLYGVPENILPKSIVNDSQGANEIIMKIAERYGCEYIDIRNCCKSAVEFFAKIRFFLRQHRITFCEAMRI